MYQKDKGIGEIINHTYYCLIFDGLEIIASIWLNKFIGRELQFKVNIKSNLWQKFMFHTTFWQWNRLFDTEKYWRIY